MGFDPKATLALWTAPKPLSAAGRPASLFLWASESNVRHCGPPPNPSRQLAGLPLGSRQACCGPQRPQLGSESFFSGLPKATLETHGPRPQTLLGSRQACRGLSVACPKPAPSLRPGPARKRSCRPQLGPESFFYGLPKATLETHGPRPQTPLGSWQACLSLLMVFRERRWACGRPPNPSRQLAGLPLGSRQACCGLSVACPKPASSLLMGFRRRR